MIEREAANAEQMINQGKHKEARLFYIAIVEALMKLTALTKDDANFQAALKTKLAAYMSKAEDCAKKEKNQSNYSTSGNAEINPTGYGQPVMISGGLGITDQFISPPIGIKVEEEKKDDLKLPGKEESKQDISVDNTPPTRITKRVGS